MDSLTGDASGMRDLLMPALELHGLVAAKADRSSAGASPVTDVDDLRKSVAGTDSVADNAIRDFDGFATWFATAAGPFHLRAAQARTLRNHATGAAQV